MRVRQGLAPSRTTFSPMTWSLEVVREERSKSLSGSRFRSRARLGIAGFWLAAKLAKISAIRANGGRHFVVASEETMRPQAGGTADRLTRCARGWTQSASRWRPSLSCRCTASPPCWRLPAQVKDKTSAISHVRNTARAFFRWPSSGAISSEPGAPSWDGTAQSHGVSFPRRSFTYPDVTTSSNIFVPSSIVVIDFYFRTALEKLTNRDAMPPIFVMKSKRGHLAHSRFTSRVFSGQMIAVQPSPRCPSACRRPAAKNAISAATGGPNGEPRLFGRGRDGPFGW